MFIILLLALGQSKKTNQVGQLLSREGLPIGAKLKIKYPNYETVCDEQGYFTLQQSEFEINVLEQFSQQFDPTVSNKFIIDNNQTIFAEIKGNIIGGIAKISLNFSEPLNLRMVQFSVEGRFKESVDLMKLMVYGVDIIIESEGFKSIRKQISLYNEYNFDLGDIQLESNQIRIRMNLGLNSQALAMCVVDNRNMTGLFGNNGILDGLVYDEWPQLCLVYTENLQWELLEWNGGQLGNEQFEWNNNQI